MKLLNRGTWMTKIFLIIVLTIWIVTPTTTDAANKNNRSAHKVNLKPASYKNKPAYKFAKKSRPLKSERHVKHVLPAVDSTANYADLVMNGKTGRILHATSPDELRHPASLTKMMTLYLTFQAIKSGQLDLDQLLPVSQHASIQVPSKLGLRVGQKIRVEDALLGLVTQSANDATVVLAESLGGTEENFAQMMTGKARELGMNRTVFRNASGLPDPEQVTTARDMAILGYALINHHPQFYPYFKRTGFTYAGVRYSNHNHLMSRYHGMDGIKTGYIRASGFNLVASTVRGSTRLIAVVFGGRSSTARDNRMAALLDQSFAQLENKQHSAQQMDPVDEKTEDNAKTQASLPKMRTNQPMQHVAVK